MRLLVVAAALIAVMTVGAAKSASVPLVIAHRGASGVLPEHTLEAYARAIALGADFIEPDLVATRDGVLIARHDPVLGATTDVSAHPEFAGRRVTRAVDGREVTDWFTSDFTLAEIRTLRARQPMAGRDTRFDGRFAIPTFDEVVALVRESAANGRPVGLYPETKHSVWHRALGLPLEEALLAALARAGWVERAAPVILQSFDVANLKALRAQTRVHLVQLIAGPDARPYDFTLAGDARRYRDLLTPGGLASIAAYADGIGVPKELLFNASGAPSPLVREAHAAGLFVHAYTFRDESRFVLEAFAGDPRAEYAAAFSLGLDGLFSDFPDSALAARPK
jgi:glycerophosphoryl diester phosphodiesterase